MADWLADFCDAGVRRLGGSRWLERGGGDGVSMFGVGRGVGEESWEEVMGCYVVAISLSFP